MMRKAFIGACFLMAANVAGQIKDTLQLDEAQVTEFLVKADNTFKEERISADSLAQIGRLTLGEALRDYTGIFVKSYGGNGVATLSFRGTGASHTKVFWNNLDVGSPMLGLADLSTIPVNAFDELNVQYGFASLSDGSGALGGSLRLDNTANFQSGNSIHLQQMAGSFDRYQSSVKLNLGTKKFRSETQFYYYTAENDFSYPDITQADRPEKVMQNSAYQQEGAIQNFYYRLSGKKMLSLKAWYNHVDRELPPTIIGNMDTKDRLEDYNLSAIAEYNQEGEKSNLKVNSGLVKADNIFINGGSQKKDNNRFVSWQNNLRYQYRFSKKLESESGISYRYDVANSGKYEEQESRNHSSVFSNWQYHFSEKGGLSLLLREELINQTFSPLIGSIGAYQNLGTKSKVRVNVARNYRYPTLNDFYWDPGGNPDLKPEQSWNLEAGYDYTVFNSEESRNHQKVAIKGFYNLVDDWIQWVPEANYTTPVNLKKVENAGVEIETSGSLKFGNWRLSNRVSYAYTHSTTVEVYGDENGNGQLPYVPYHKVSGGLSLQLKKWELRYSQNYTSCYYTTAGNDVYMPSYTVANVSLLHKNLLKSDKNKLSAAFTVFNIFNYPYQVLPYRPEPGINISVQLNYQLGL